jgi:hypothetical protein
VRRGEHDTWTLLNGRRHYQEASKNEDWTKLLGGICVCSRMHSIGAIEPTCVSPTCPADTRNDDGYLEGLAKAPSSDQWACSRAVDLAAGNICWRR